VRASEKAATGTAWPWGERSIPCRVLPIREAASWSLSFILVSSLHLSQERILANNYATSYLNAPCFRLSCDHVTKFIVRSLFFVKRRRRRRRRRSVSIFFSCFEHFQSWALSLCLCLSVCLICRSCFLLLTCFLWTIWDSLCVPICCCCCCSYACLGREFGAGEY
jgi:hypothetical protein